MKKSIDEQSIHSTAESPFKSVGGLRRIFNAAINSLHGLRDAWQHESAFRQELALVIILLPIACWVDVTRVERVLLIGSALLILIVELMNSSVEAAIDRISLERHHLSKRAKDLGSAAVMLTLLTCFLTWLIILLG